MEVRVHHSSLVILRPLENHTFFGHHKRTASHYEILAACMIFSKSFGWLTWSMFISDHESGKRKAFGDETLDVLWHIWATAASREWNSASVTCVHHCFAKYPFVRFFIRSVWIECVVSEFSRFGVKTTCFHGVAQVYHLLTRKSACAKNHTANIFTKRHGSSHSTTPNDFLFSCGCSLYICLSFPRGITFEKGSALWEHWCAGVTLVYGLGDFPGGAKSQGSKEVPIPSW